jgi:hypothetical protein
MRFELMGEPCFARIVKSIGDCAMLVGTAKWMQVAKDMLPALVSVAISGTLVYLLPTSWCVDRYEQEAERTLEEILVASFSRQRWNLDGSIDRSSIRSLRCCIVSLVENVQAHRAFNAWYGCCFRAICCELRRRFFEADLLNVFSEL